MKLLLVKPNIGRREHSLYVDQGRMEPLMLGLLGALAGPDVEVKLADDRCEAMPYEEQFDLVAITVETFSARRAYEISAEFRRRGRAVVLGGMHPHFCPKRPRAMLTRSSPATPSRSGANCSMTHATDNSNRYTAVNAKPARKATLPPAATCTATKATFR